MCCFEKAVLCCAEEKKERWGLCPRPLASGGLGSSPDLQISLSPLANASECRSVTSGVARVPCVLGQEMFLRPLSTNLQYFRCKSAEEKTEYLL